VVSHPARAAYLSLGAIYRREYSKTNASGELERCRQARGGVWSAVGKPLHQSEIYCYLSGEPHPGGDLCGDDGFVRRGADARVAVCGGRISPGSTRRQEGLAKGFGPIVSQGRPFVGQGRTAGGMGQRRE
jgi:hypothetical protein